MENQSEEYKLDSKSIQGSIFIFFALIISIAILYTVDQQLLQNIVLILAIVSLIGFISGYIFGKNIKTSITYLVVIGEGFIVLLFFVFFGAFQTASGSTGGWDAVALILVVVIILVLIIAGFIAFGLLGFVLYISGLVGIRLAKK